jgi:hypothetical protein
LSASKQGNTSFVLTDEPTRVRYFLTSIEDCLDQKLISRIESVKSDDGPNGKNNEFDLCVQYLLPACPVYNRQKSDGYTNNDGANNKKNVSVSEVTIQKGKGKTGVDLRWHKYNEYNKLNREQKDELGIWQRSAEGKKAKDKYKGGKRSYTNDGNINPNGKKFRGAVAAGVAAAVKRIGDKEERSKQQCTALATELASVLSVPQPPPPAIGSLAVRTNNVNAQVASILKSSGVRFDENE